MTDPSSIPSETRNKLDLLVGKYLKRERLRHCPLSAVRGPLHLQIDALAWMHDQGIPFFYSQLLAQQSRKEAKEDRKRQSLSFSLTLGTFRALSCAV